MKHRQKLTLLTTVALAAVTAFGISSGTRPAQAKGTVTAALAGPVTVPAGIYTTTIAPADVPPDFPPEVVDILVGDWQIEITEDGGSIVTKDDEVVVVGRYTFSPSHVVAQDLGGPLACFDAHGIATGIYTWSFQNDELTLSPVLDRCFGRQFVLTVHQLQKQ